jgi:alkyl hydroperoxide reductase subunit AhpC
MAELTALANVFAVNVDIPDNSRWLKELDKITVPVLLDNDNLKVVRMYDMDSQPGRPMGGMRGVPTMEFVLIDGEGVIRKMRANIYFGRDADYLIRVLKTL